METKKLSEKNKDFFDMVYQVTRLVPKGRVTSFGAIANYLGSKRGARMVGWALSGSHNQKEFVPAHRVLNRNGILSGKVHFGGPFEMQKRLDEEGVKVENDQVVEFEKLFWDPSLELENM